MGGLISNAGSAGKDGKGSGWTVLFLAFNALLFFIVSLMDDPLPFFVVCTVGIIPFFYLHRVRGFFEILLLLVFLSSAETLHLNVGNASVVAGVAGLLLFHWCRSCMDGFGGWSGLLFRRELALFIGVLFLSLFYGPSPFHGLPLLVVVCGVGFVFTAVTHHTCASAERLHYLTLFLMILFLANGLYAIFDFLQYQGRAVSFFVDTPTYSGHLFAQGIAVSLGALFSPSFRKSRGWIIAIILVLATALFLTLTRAAYLSVGLLLILSVTFYRIPKRIILLGTAGVALFLAVFMLFIDTASLGFMFRQRMEADVQNLSLSVGSIAFRVLLWKSALEIFLANPLLGVGFDNFVTANASTTLFPVISGLGGADLYAHNVILQFLAETGVVGTAVFLVLCTRVFLWIRSFLKRTIDSRIRSLLLGYAGAWGLWLFMSLTEASFYTPGIALFFFFYLGVFSGIGRTTAAQETNEDRH